ncbi:MAG: TonB-dependent receptor [Deferrisomatales bacterium]|nr:TonB-dependent receptor [Deferrisomatales bacterium]
MRRILGPALLGIALCSAGPAPAQNATLEPVVVTATRTPRQVSQVGPSVTVIPAEEILASGARRLQEVLRDAVGVTVVETGAPGSLATASIRGSEAQQVLVLLDGIRLNSSQLGQFDLANLPVPLEQIERIEVLRGPASALYGSNALAGVIHVITRRPEAEPRTTFSWSEARHDTRELSFSASRRVGSLGYRFGASRDHSQGYRDNSDLDRTTLDGLLAWYLPGGFVLEGHGYHLQKEIGVPGMEGFFETPDARQRDENTSASLSLRGPLGPVTFTGRGGYDRFDNRFRDPGAFFPTDDRHLAETVGGEVQIDTPIRGQGLTLGSELYRDFLDSSSAGNRDQARWAAFGQQELAVAPWASVLLGVRYDGHSDFRNEWSPRTSLLLSTWASGQVRASAGRAYRAPTFNDRFWPFDGFTRGNPDLDPERAWEYEVGVSQGLGHWGSASLTGFRRDAKDLIDWQPEDAADPFSVWSPVNVRTSRTWGAEAFTALSLYEGLGLGANYTYLHAVDRDTGDFLLGKPRHQASAHVDVEPIWDLRFRLTGRYARYPSAPNRPDPVYTVFDARVSRPVIVADAVAVDVTVGVDNLFDRDYEVNPGFPMPPRTWRAGLTATF